MELLTTKEIKPVIEINYEDLKNELSSQLKKLNLSRFTLVEKGL